MIPVLETVWARFSRRLRGRIGAASVGVSMLAALGLIWLAVPLAAQTAAPKIEGPFPAKEGETCVVCNGALTRADVAYVVDGQRVAMQRSLEAAFLADPARYIRNSRPEGMLFSGYSRPAPNWTLFLGGLWVLAGLVFGSLSAQLAISRGRPPAPWFFAGLMANAFAWSMLRARPAVDRIPLPPGLEKVPTTPEPTACPACGSANHPLAGRCLRCGATLAPAAPSESDRVRYKENPDA